MNIHSTRQGSTLNRNAITTRSQDKVVGSESPRDRRAYLQKNIKISSDKRKDDLGTITDFF